jgi:hypothetical protein
MKDRNIIHIVFWLVFILTISPLTGQQSSRNGVYLTTSGTIRTLLVFAQVTNDPADTNNYTTWPRSQMPANPGYFFDPVWDSANIQGQLTKYYNQASFGKLKVIGDYLDALAQVNYNFSTVWNGYWEILPFLNAYPDQYPPADLVTKHGYAISGSSFDQWHDSAYYSYFPKKSITDNYIDLLAVLWRVNSRAIAGNNSGRSGATSSKPLKGKSGFNATSRCTNWDATDWSATRHEINHGLIGGNDFHTGGHGGVTRQTMPKQGGYSMLNYDSEVIGVLYNAWDRWRLGWKHPSKQYYISAFDANTRQEIETDLQYVAGAPHHDYILRDFVNTGDAIRIELPYLQSESSIVNKQYIWLENHQMIDGNLDLKKISAKGLYAYIQVGLDSDTILSSSGAHYLTFLHGLGNFDITYSTDKTVYLNADKQNPLTGYNIIQGLAYNLVEPNIDSSVTPWVYYTDKILTDEIFYPTGVVKDGITLPSSDFVSQTHPCWGSNFDPFTPGRRIGLGTNPAPTPVLTYLVQDGNPLPDHQDYDNRTIYLSGLSITLTLNPPTGEILVHVDYSDYNVRSDARWCGPIVLKEKVFLANRALLTLDQGLTPTRPVNPILFNGEKIYADPTIFTAEGGSEFSMGIAAEVKVKNNSAYISEYNGLLEIGDGAVFQVKTGSTLLLKEGSDLVISGTGKLEVETGGCLCIENGASITLQDATSQIHLLPDVVKGVNTSVLTGSYDCRYNLVSTPYSGSGHITNDVSSLDKYFQNESIPTQTISKRDIYFGEKVTTTKAFGLVIIPSGTNVVADASRDILLDNGFEAALGCTFEMK